ncbi:hypothetical protein PanWU01x14_214350 [Parasponia andersonii]|uniref:Transmembrane protein n=1 Tax=Parasponia andersonii TaxID=3476 RepID=A0A2P5BSJ8_PARAD|nr:hypothetical protein PanWU01x14_214350 [Parasponia andersonii]
MGNGDSRVGFCFFFLVLGFFFRSREKMRSKMEILELGFASFLLFWNFLLGREGNSKGLWRGENNWWLSLMLGGRTRGSFLRLNVLQTRGWFRCEEGTVWTLNLICVLVEDSKFNPCWS